MEGLKEYLEKQRLKKLKRKIRPVQEPDDHGPAQPFLGKKFKKIGLIIGQEHFNKGGKKNKKLENINGPCLIKVPSWVENPLGKYYLYFANHQGKYIRLAYSENVEGPYTLHEPGCLHVNEHPIEGTGHVASPDILIQQDKREIWLYYHGKTARKTEFQGKFGNQWTYLATSKDGLHFEARAVPISGAYLRVFPYRGKIFGVTHKISCSKDGVEPFMLGSSIMPGTRHLGILRKENILYILYTKKMEVPERIYYVDVDLEPMDWRTWKPSNEEGILILYPEEPWEGGDLPHRQAMGGAAFHRSNQVRDPFAYVENDDVYLLYSVAGEFGIGLAKLE